MDTPLDQNQIKAPTALAPTTTAEQNLSTAGQRKVNLIWEFTQSAIAILVTLATLAASIILTLRADPNLAAFVLLSNAFFLVVGFYFGRTNHQRTGGVGALPLRQIGEYEGR